jgi:hypothetical protein
MTIDNQLLVQGEFSAASGTESSSSSSVSGDADVDLMTYEVVSFT